MPNDKGIRIPQYNGMHSVFTNRDFGPPDVSDVSVSGLYIYNGFTTLPDTCLIGTGLSLSGGYLNGFSGDYNQLSNQPTLFSGDFGDLTNLPTTLAGYGITDGVTSTDLSTGLSGKFNNPAGTTAQYIRGDGSLVTFPSLTSGTVTSVTAGTGLSGGVITTSGTISLPNTGTAGTYSGVTTDAQGRVSAGTNRSFGTPSRSLVNTTSSTGFQISSTRDSFVSYAGQIQTTTTIGGPASGSVFLETANTNSTTPGDWTEVISQTCSNTVTLAVVLQVVDGEPWGLSAMIPAGKFVRIRSGTPTGTVSYSINATQQEVLL